MAEHLTVDQVVVGSTPITHPRENLPDWEGFLFWLIAAINSLNSGQLAFAKI